jgi:hypothetical protein
MPPAAPPTQADRVYTALFLLSLAVRSLPDGDEPARINIDRASVWKLASASGIPVTRNRFHAATLELAQSTETALVVLTQHGGRRAISIERPASDDYGWCDEVLEPLGFEDVDTAITAAIAYGYDTTTPLPAELLQRIPIEAEEITPELDSKPCTKCTASKSTAEFPARSNGRLSSWCNACHREATSQYRARARAA